MHIFQKHILDSLRKTASLRYSQLQPDDIESSHFKYHLNQLIKDGLVEQLSRGVYGLSIKGKSEVDRLSQRGVNIQPSPKVITYTLLQDTESYHLQRKDKEPYLGLLNLIGGKVHLGESSAESAQREVKEKTNLAISKPTLCGTAEIKIFSGSNLLTHVIAYIYSANMPAGRTDQLNQVNKQKITSQKDLAPDCLQIIQSIESESKPFSINLDIDL